MESFLNDATDPCDWKHDFVILKELDASLRCDLCFDIYKNPVSIKSCNHTFCSECIRTHINQSGNSGSFCPKCRQSKAYDSELIPQPVLETTALEWVKARDFLAGLQQRERQRIALKHTRETSEQTGSSSTLASPNGRNTHREDDGTPPRRSKRIRTEVLPRSVQSAGSRSSPLTLDDEDEVVTMSDDDGDGVVGSSHDRDEQDADYTQDNVAITSTSASHDKQRQLKPSDAVACPICQHDFTLTALDRHLDAGNCFPGCPAPSLEQQGFASTASNGTTTASLSSSRNKSGSAWFTTTAPTTTSHLANGKRRARPQYHLKSDRDLRTLLSEAELPTTGDRETVINRHRQWINLWNANLDSTKARKSAAQLRKELAQWEKLRTGAKDHSAIVERQKTSWVSTNKTQFDELIKVAKEGAARNKMLREQMKAAPDANGIDPASDPSSTRNGTATDSAVVASEPTAE